jgi:mRNA-degrading endonuclease RelE of RelBE toxin-antitoxin system
MRYEILITPTAIRDIASAVKYYNLKVKDLGYKFADEIDNCIREIAIMPKAYSIKYQKIRGRSLKKFPFLILYNINESASCIEIVRVFNTYQNQYWDVKER